MKPTAGNWTYNEDDAQIKVLGDPIAEVYYYDAPDTPTKKIADVNGYLMAAAPNLRDELTNLSRAVRDLLLVSNDPIASAEEAQRCWDTVENMCQRAERALATIFPPEHES